MRLFIILFFAELFVSIKVGITIGFLWSVVWILLTIVIGVTLLRLSPYAFSFGIENFVVGKFNLKMLNSLSISYMFGAILLIIPGVLSDTLGVLLLMYILYLHLFVTIPGKYYNGHDNSNYKGDLDVIDTEIINERNSSYDIDKSR